MNTRQARAGNGNRIAFGALIAVVSLFCLLSDVGALAGVGDMVSSFLIGFFGLADYAYSVVGILIGLAIIFNFRLKLRRTRALEYIGLFLLGVLALHVYSSSANIIGADYGGYLMNCYNYTNTAGGMLFGIVAFPLMKLITSVGALALICVLFFALAFLAFFPFVKKNVTYTSATKRERETKEKIPRSSRNKAGNPIGIQKAPVLTDLSAVDGGGQGLFVVDVEGDPLSKKSKKAKGADGYNPLYPNAMGNLEDEIRLPDKTDPADKFSARGLARDILLNKNPTRESYERFNAAINPGESKGVGAPFSAVRRSELRNKLGIDTSQSAIRESFREQYNLNSDELRGLNKNSGTDDSAGNTGAIFGERDGNDLYGSKTFGREKSGSSNENTGSRASVERTSEAGGAIDFHELKKEQLKRFSEMCGGVKPEFEATAYDTPTDPGGAARAETVKRELLKPKRTRSDTQADSINETIQRAQNAVNQNSNLSGLQGAVNRAINGEEQVKPKGKPEIEAEAYERPSVKPKLNGAPEGRIPRAFEDTAIDTAAKDAVNAKDKAADNNYHNIYGANTKGVNPSERILPVGDDLAGRNGGASNNGNESDPNEIKRDAYGAYSGTSGQNNNAGVPYNNNSFDKSGRSAKAGTGLNSGAGANSDGELIRDDDNKRYNEESGGNFEIRGNRNSLIYNKNYKPKEDKIFGGPASYNPFDSARAAGKEAPPMSAAERHAMEERAIREQKVKASRDRGLQKTEQLAKKLQSIDASKERVTQVNIDQAISQAAPRSPYVAPPIRLLNPPEAAVSQNEDYEAKKRVLLDTLMSFNIEAEVTDIMVGPTFSLYTLKVTMPKNKTVGYLYSLEKQITMQMEEESVRIIAPIPGRNAVGIEVPNKHRRIVRLSEIITSPAFNKSKSPATFALGTNLYGVNYVCEVNSLPHMLIAGATGAGKSCCINSIIISLLYKASPEDVRLILIDPKRVELSVYEGIPHLLMDEIICDVDKAIRALNWSIGEMNRRIEYLSNLKYRDIDEHNQDCERNGFEKMPRIVIIVDELADLMAMGGKSVEESINRVARLARAVGIHLILATQRPSVDVISGTIKNNLPTRVAFKVTSGPDSRTILDANGADKLLGNGDLLYMTPKVSQPERMQGAFISNEEVKAVVDFIKKNNDSYFDNSIKDAIFKEKPEEKQDAKERSGKKSGLPPELFDALRLGMESETLSISYIQRKLGFGWPKAAKIFDMMEDMGYLVPDEKDPKRKRVQITELELDMLISDNLSGDEE